MKLSHTKLFLVSTILLAASSLTMAQTAILYPTGDAVTIKVNLAPKIIPTTQPVAGGLYSIDSDGNWIQVAPLPNMTAPFTEFNITISKAQYDPKHDYTVVVFGSFKAKDGTSAMPSQSVSVTLPLVVTIVRDNTNCRDGITLLAKTELGKKYDWKPYYDWLAPFESHPQNIAKIDIKKSGVSTVDPYTAKSVVIVTDKVTAERTGNSRVCIVTNPDLPGRAFNATVTLNPTDLPQDIAGQPTGTGLSGAYVADFPKRQDIDDPSKRVLEKNLDLGVSLTSAVKDEDVAATATTPKTTVRKRTTRGVLDVRFAPWLDVWHPIIKENKWLNFFTPIYLNANVATGSITKDTLALNRILFGFEGESRYYTSRRWTDEKGNPRHSNPIWHRVKWGAQHASDRDFKQDEFTGKIEYAPIFEALYNPYKFNFTGTSNEKVQKPFGYSFQPKVGFELGRTYHRRNPAAAVQPSATVRRFYFGGDIGLDLSQYTSFSITDLFFIRGELPDNRASNYFKGSFDLRFRPANVTSSGVFLSFERGQLPPFANPSVNVVKVGYRIVSNYCQDSCR